MTLIIALNVLFSALVLTVIVGGHARALIAGREEHTGAERPATLPRQRAAHAPARSAYATS